MSRIVLAATVVAVAGVLGGPGLAQEEPPAPSSSAVSQYAELVPTGSGPTAPGVKETELAALGPRARQALEQTSEATAKALATIATSSDYGAPRTTPGSADVAPGDDPSPGGGASLDRTFQAAAGAASPVDDAYMIGLLLALLVITVGGAGLAIRARGS
jgi:hypothetical protein